MSTMHPDLLNLLACPKCRGDLHYTGDANEHLLCIICGNRYPIIEGIPRFAGTAAGPPLSDASSIAEQFSTEFSVVERGDRDIDPLPLREYLFFSRTGLDPRLYEATLQDPYPTELDSFSYTPAGDILRDRVVLDAGCGPARFTEVAAKHGARLVVGLELGDHVERAARRCHHLPNTAFVQGSVLQPPFKPEVFDVVFSVGVLHHTGAPREGAEALGRLVAPAGSLSIWVYPPEYWGRGPQRPIAKTLHRIIASYPPATGWRFCERWLYPLGRIQMAVHQRKVLRFLLAPLFLIKVPRHPVREVMLATIFDYYAPTRITTHAPEEVSTWLEEDGFTNVTPLPVRSAVIGTRPGQDVGKGPRKPYPRSAASL